MYDPDRSPRPVGRARRPISNPLLFMTLAFIYHTFVGVSATARPIENLTIERIFGDRPLLRPLPAGIEWLGNSEAVSYLKKSGPEGEEQTRLVVREVPSGKDHVVCILDTVAVPGDLRESNEANFSVGSYEWDKKARRVVFLFAGDVFTIERDDGKVTRWTMTDEDEQDPTFSPEGDRIAYTRGNDLYVLDLDRGEETRLTTTGSETVRNGVLDWVYMEELFTRGNVRAFCWSPDGERVAFLELREDSVPEFPMVDWSPINPKFEPQRYPQAGDTNPLVRVGIVRAEGGEIVWADTDTSDDSYIARLYWLGDSRGVAIEKLNRAQDNLTLMFAEARSGKISIAFEETDRTWVNVNYLKHYYEKSRRFIWGSERSGHSHLYLYNIDGTPIRQLTNGNWEVTTLDGVDESKHKIYFTANKKNVLERHLYVVSDKGGEIRQITSGDGTHQVKMSPDCKYFIDRFHNERTPTMAAVYSVKGKKLFEIGNRSTPDLEQMNRPVPEFLSFTSSAGIEFYCSITKPTNFNRLQEYPVIVYTYGGPHAQVVRRAWSSQSLWMSYLADKGFIVFSLDNRGSFGRGKEWEDHLYKNLGRVELEDQLAGVEYLKSLPYVDADRIGIWGWSYGGFMTLMALFKAPEVFAAGVAVAPVVDWRLYDSIYTERYMKLPSDNEEGYEQAAPINFASALQGKLLLMHGGADDNVHIQNSIQLVDALIKAGKDFDFMLYPNKRHGIRGKKQRVHLFKKMAGFFERELLDRR